ncbi:hypothetical protein JYK14_08430 [Siccirubricoccus sp. KC 17139]|uniref:Lipoprotein n=1 Tax=Siccirubricoccus soli TaxID=2899147 RepID=A0ABT1D2P5_9PROT|nr:hypothetical protein [Siccirubricoccus soli]MCO6416193.1 hypothetical protein [Siccirubricoccus soli]MCP2682327.1 hypothetical protein [Siccirubricoccus soli]
MAALLLPPLLGACAGAPDLRDRPPAAVVETEGNAARLASCLADAYADDPFRLDVVPEGQGTRITALGMPGRLVPLRRRPRFEIEVSQAGPETARVVLRTVPTLLGPEAEAARLRRRVTACAGATSGPTFRSIAGTPRTGLRALPGAPDRPHCVT